MSNRDYPIHPYALSLPPMSDQELHALERDVSAVGCIREPLVLLDDQILDGRNRKRVADKLRLPCQYAKYDPAWGDPLEWVKSRHTRRNMDDGQRACWAIGHHQHRLAHLRAEAKGRQGRKTSLQNLQEGGLSAGEAMTKLADEFGVCRRYVYHAGALYRDSKKLFEAVLSGQQRLHVAARRVTLGRKRKEASRRNAKPIWPNATDFAEVIVGDCGQIMPTLSRGKFRLIFADPPYNLGFKYDADPTKDALAPDSYIAASTEWVAQCSELLSPDGTLCWMVPEEWVASVGIILRDVGLHVRRLIVWHESFGQAGVNNFGRTCRFIWYATKSKTDFVFDAASILIDSKRATQYGDKRAMPGGKVPDAMWDFSRLCGTFGERIPDEGIPTQLPIALVQRAVKCFTEPGDTVFDPFGGTGTTARAAISLGRKCVTIERSKKYAAIIKRELVNLAGAPSKVNA